MSPDHAESVRQWLIAMLPRGWYVHVREEVPGARLVEVRNAESMTFLVIRSGWVKQEGR